MKKEDKQKLFVILVLLMFFGSSFAFAIQYAPDLFGGQQEEQTEQKLTYDVPLSVQQEAAFLKQNYVIVKYFYNETCLKCEFISQALDKIFSDLNQKIVIQKIDTAAYPDEAEDAGVTNVPFFYLKGRLIDNFEYKSSNDLFVRVCNAYIQPIPECEFQ